MNALARQDVRQCDACGQHSHPHFTRFGIGALLFKYLKGIRPAVMGDDDSRVSHDLLPRCKEYSSARRIKSVTDITFWSGSK